MSAHPFCQSFSHQDVRITGRVDESFLNMLLFGTMHETGHALYDQGVSSAFLHTPLDAGASLGIHESQSRMWENLVGRSHEFWQFFYPQLQEVFPERFKNVKLDEFYRDINRVSPSFIRVEADEVTHNLHIMVRFELELDLLEGRLNVAGLPAAWNAKYKDYLGITPPNDAIGVLQDMPTLRQSIASGDFSPLLGWLRENIHQYGRKYTPDQLLKRATGKKLSAKPYIKYLQRKYKKIYEL